MALEVPAYVPDLVAANPPNTDQRKQGDDHLRAIKTAVRQSLELFGGGMTTGGTSTAYTVTTAHVNSPTYKDGHLYAVALHTANGASATINYDGQGARTFKKLTSAGSWVDLAANDYPANTVLLFYYEGGDSTMRVIASSVSNAFLPLIGGTLTGDLAISKSGPTLTLNTGNANENALLSLQRNGSQRWFLGKDNVAESGSDAGSDFFINNYSDAGAFKTTVVRVRRSSGNVELSGQLLSANSITANNGGANNVVLSTDGGIEITRSGGGAYVDFKNAVEDFDVRIAQVGTTDSLEVTTPTARTNIFAKNTPSMVVSVADVAGTPTVQRNMNVTSITDNGVGDFTINLTSAIASAETALLCGNMRYSAVNSGIPIVAGRNIDRTQTTTAIQVATWSGGTNDARDANRWAVATIDGA